MSERKLRIKNYRNVGVEEEQELLLNTSYVKGEMGNLVIVVGPNNSGKTNCLDALLAFGRKNGIEAKDIPDFNNDNPMPKLSIVISNEDVTIGVDKYLTSEMKEIENYFYSDKENKFNHKIEPVINASKKAQDFAFAVIAFNVNNGQVSRIPAPHQEIARSIASSAKFNNDYNLLAKVHQVNVSIWGNDYVRNNIGLQYDNAQIQSIMNEFKPIIPAIPQEISIWEEKNQLNVFPNIVRFTETVTSHNQLTVVPDQITNSPFFKTLFYAIGYDIDALVNCYTKAKSQNLYGLLKKTSKEINIKLEDIAKQFNKLFFQSDKKYSFEITLEKEAIYLSIFIDDVVLHLDKQSSGFKWFFNFYFTVIAQTKLQRGDIIVMDEPATNLHMQGIQELRTFIKDFAKKTELTIIISTHIPFFVDVDYLEEVRIVSRVGDGAIIENKFHAIGGQETDALKSIKDALTVGRYVLYDQGNTHTIFVEGITDYCYLSAFKNLFKLDSIVFLPIQGIRKPGIVDTLLKVEKLPTILVDGDPSGIAFKEKNKGRKNVEIISLKDIDDTWITIEDLFSQEDKQKTKYFNDCVSFKNRLTSNKVSKETKTNFKKLLENIVL